VVPVGAGGDVAGDVPGIVPAVAVDDAVDEPGSVVPAPVVVMVVVAVVEQGAPVTSIQGATPAVLDALAPVSANAARLQPSRQQPTQ
jgi:hypothetical protein